MSHMSLTRLVDVSGEHCHSHADGSHVRGVYIVDYSVKAGHFWRIQEAKQRQA